MPLHRFIGPQTTAVTIDSLGENLPFELGPWKGVGVARIPEEHDPELMREVEECGFGLRPRPVSELSNFVDN
jgi:hypothetical protein